MRFNSYTFFVFLLIYLLFWVATRKKNTFFKAGTLFFSYLFYAWSYPPYVFLLLTSTFIDFFCGIKIDAANAKKQKRIFLIISLCANLGMLAYFKYFNFFLDVFGDIAGISVQNLNILLPVGISFYTFQSMSYTIDVYRGKIHRETSFLDFALYVSFFPQLVAGPIVFARDFLKQLKNPPLYNVDNLYRGIMLILFGLFLKSVIADSLSNGVDQFFLNPEQFTAYEAFYYCYCYAFQIFGDFAGYSYIAIGIALVIGYVFPKNFDYPYLSLSITDFWHRWHMSLSHWLKEYLYFSLGGNRRGQIITYVNLMITMLLGGLWHGASWNFVIWGGIHGIMLSIEKFLMKVTPALFESKNKLLLFVRWFITFHLVILAWIFFRTSTLSSAFTVFRTLTNFSDSEFLLQARIPFVLISLIFIAAIFREKIYKFIFSSKVAYSFTAFILFYLWLTMGKNSNSFIYFQF
jgi:D-alanyl-lipoteichoic acid acyltransferase DltB (MBOAT superfamily)